MTHADPQLSQVLIVLRYILQVNTTPEESIIIPQQHWPAKIPH